jgi:hypothetical protein
LFLKKSLKFDISPQFHPQTSSKMLEQKVQFSRKLNQQKLAVFVRFHYSSLKQTQREGKTKHLQ